MKNSSDTIWNRTRDLPACSVVPVTVFSTVYYQRMKYMLTEYQYLKYRRSKSGNRRNDLVFETVFGVLVFCLIKPYGLVNK